MKVTFIHSEDESLGIEYISSVLKEHGHEVDLLFDPRLFNQAHFSNPALSRAFNVEDLIIQKVKSINPGIVAFSVYTRNYQWALRLSAAIKKELNVPVIFGGMHPTSVPSEVIKNPCVDMLCIGEGEDAMSEVADSLEKGALDHTIKNIWFKTGGNIIRNEVRPLEQNIDRLPFPDKRLFFDILPRSMKKGYIILTSRGCPFNCTFCGNNVLQKTYSGKGRVLRLRTIGNVIAELTEAKERFKFKKVYFLDATFSTNKKWLLEFLREYREKVALPFGCESHPNTVDEELIRNLKEAGCEYLMLGLETGCEDVRRKIFNRRESNKRVAEVAGLCHAYKLKFSVDHIFDVPYETREDNVRSLEFYNTIRPDVINTYNLQYFPGTDIVGIAEKAGIIKQEDIDKINKGTLEGSYMGGIGRNDLKRKHSSGNEKFHLWFNLLPMLPKGLMDLIIEKRFYDSRLAALPAISTFFKFLSKLKANRLDIYFDIIKKDLYFTRKILSSKFISKKLTF